MMNFVKVAAIEDVPNAILLWDEDDILITVNKAVREITKKQGSNPKPGMSYREVKEDEYNYKYYHI